MRKDPCKGAAPHGRTVPAALEAAVWTPKGLTVTLGVSTDAGEKNGDGGATASAGESTEGLALTAARCARDGAQVVRALMADTPKQ